MKNIRPTLPPLSLGLLSALLTVCAVALSCSETKRDFGPPLGSDAGDSSGGSSGRPGGNAGKGGGNVGSGGKSSDSGAPNTEAGAAGETGTAGSTGTGGTT